MDGYIITWQGVEKRQTRKEGKKDIFVFFCFLFFFLLSI